MAEERPKLKPGIYIGARNINFLNHPWMRKLIPGKHQFYVMIPKNPRNFRGKLRNLGGGVKGIVMGAYDSKKGLKSKLFQRAETTAARDWAQGDNDNLYDPDVQRVNIRGKGIDRTIKVMLRMRDNFEKKIKKNPIEYNFAAKGGLNSNAWAQSIGEYAGLKRRVKDFAGLDPGKDAVVPEEYFKKAANMKKQAGKNTARNVMIGGAGLGAVGGALVTMASAALIGGRGAKWWETLIGTGVGAAAGVGASRGVLELSRRYMANRMVLGINGYDSDKADLNTRMKKVLLPHRTRALYERAMKSARETSGIKEGEVTALDFDGLGTFISEMWKTRNDPGGFTNGDTWKGLIKDMTTKPNLDKLARTYFLGNNKLAETGTGAKSWDEYVKAVGQEEAMNTVKSRVNPDMIARGELFARGVDAFDESKGRYFKEAPPSVIENLKKITGGGKGLTSKIMMPTQLFADTKSELQGHRPYDHDEISHGLLRAGKESDAGIASRDQGRIDREFGESVKDLKAAMEGLNKAPKGSSKYLKGQGGPWSNYAWKLYKDKMGGTKGQWYDIWDVALNPGESVLKNTNMSESLANTTRANPSSAGANFFRKILDNILYGEAVTATAPAISFPQDVNTEEVKRVHTPAAWRAMKQSGEALSYPKNFPKEGAEETPEQRQARLIAQAAQAEADRKWVEEQKKMSKGPAVGSGETKTLTEEEGRAHIKAVLAKQDEAWEAQQKAKREAERAKLAGKKVAPPATKLKKEHKKIIEKSKKADKAVKINPYLKSFADMDYSTAVASMGLGSLGGAGIGAGVGAAIDPKKHIGTGAFVGGLAGAPAGLGIYYLIRRLKDMKSEKKK